MFNRSHLLRCHLFLVVITVTGLMQGTVTAMSYWEAVIDNAVIVADTGRGNLTVRQERDLINANWADWRQQKQAAGLASVGQVAIAGFYPVVEYTPADLGTTEILTYFFIDPATGTTTTPAFEVSAVRYEALLDPFALYPSVPTESLIRDNLTLLGTSTDAANDFALNFTLEGFEPIILAFPFDAIGNEITGEGTAGFASHVVPEPATLSMLALGGIGLLRRRKV